MKLLLSFLMLLPALGYAQTAGIQEVHEVSKSTGTRIQSFSLSANAIALAAASTSSGALTGSFAIEIYNPIGNSTLNVGFDNCLSTTSSNVCYGREVAAGSGVYFATPPTSLRVRSQNTTSAQIITVTQFK